MTKVVTIPEKLDTLPFYDTLSWERYQQFCADVLFIRDNVIVAREYLSQGNGQEGIDIYATNRGTEKLTVAQCKNKKQLGPGEIKAIVKLFLDNSFAGNSGEFILCTSAHLNSVRAEKAIKEVRSLLLKSGIGFIIWDSEGLSRELRCNLKPAYIELVYRYFDESVCKAFFGERYAGEIKKLRPVPKTVYTSSPDHIPRNLTSYEERLLNPGKTGWHYWSAENPKTSLIDLVCQHETGKPTRIVLLSSAGFGKSAELQELAAYYCTPDKKLYPFKYSLGNYEGQEIELLLKHWNSDWENIPKDNLLLILDGIDEIHDRSSLSFFHKINSFLEIHTNVHVVASSRSNAFEPRHSPLKEFSIYLLDPLNRMDIEAYQQQQLKTDQYLFQELLYEKGFLEYQENPYYLTRLIRFFNDKSNQFPQNKTGLFNRILFEQMDKDISVHQTPEIKERLFKYCSQIAFCMTLAGKSGITDEELQLFTGSIEELKLLKKYGLLSRNMRGTPDWAFEHKNIQEFLCADCFCRLPFPVLHAIISLEGQPEKMLPKFLNVVSFLFELADKNEPNFKKLFDWLSQNEPELLVSFEKEQLTKTTRQEIFFRVFNTYEQKGLSLYTSANFSFQDIAAFASVDEAVVDYLAGKIKPEYPKGLLFDALQLISACERPYTIRDKITSLLFSVLRTDTYPPDVKAYGIRMFYYLGFTDRSAIDQIFAISDHLQHQSIRAAILQLLDHTSFSEEFAGYIFSFYRIYDKERDENHVREVIKRLFLKFAAPANIKRLIRFCIEYPKIIYPYPSYRTLQFNLNETSLILEKATAVYSIDKTILPLVYRLYCDQEIISMEKEWNDLFIHFFELTIGKYRIFKKFYQYGRRPHNMLCFADEQACDFLADEIRNGKMSADKAITIRNILNHTNTFLFNYFNNLLNRLPEPEQYRVLEDLNDYAAIRFLQENKNQEMLLDKTLFLQEATAVFNIAAKARITHHDLWFSDTKELRVFESSLALKSIRDLSLEGKKTGISRNEYYRILNEECFWEMFVMHSIKDLLEKTNPVVPIRKELIGMLTEWTITEILKLNTEKEVIIEHAEGGYSYFHNTEFIKECVTLLKPALPDELLLKLLRTDYSSFYSLDNTGDSENKKQSLSGFIIEKVIDKERLHKEVIANIRNPETPFRVRSTHYRICQIQGYRECLPDLYHTLINDKRLEGYERIKLAEIYTVLGGEWSDFSAYLDLPGNKNYENEFVDWNWQLMEKLLDKEPAKITDILLKVLHNDCLDSNRLKAAEMLIRLSRIEGLRYLTSHVTAKKQLFVESRIGTYNAQLRKMPFEETVSIFIEVLDVLYQSAAESTSARSWRIDDTCFNSLINLAIQGAYQYNYIFNGVTELLKKTNPEDYRYTIKYYLERISHHYYQQIQQSVDLAQALKIYDNILAGS